MIVHRNIRPGYTSGAMTEARLHKYRSTSNVPLPFPYQSHVCAGARSWGGHQPHLLFTTRDSQAASGEKVSAAGLMSNHLRVSPNYQTAFFRLTCRPSCPFYDRTSTPLASLDLRDHWMLSFQHKATSQLEPLACPANTRNARNASLGELEADEMH